MVPLHLGLIDGSFVLHNLISTQESPVPLLKFQIASRLKILMASGSKKGTQIYFSFFSKVLANQPPPGSPTGLLWRGRPICRSFCISLKKTPSFRFPSKGAPPQGSLHGIPYREMPHHQSSPSFIYQSPQYTSLPPPSTRYPFPLPVLEQLIFVLCNCFQVLLQSCKNRLLSSFCLSICQSTWNNWADNGNIVWKFDI